MSHWINRYMTKNDFENHITEEWNRPNYKGEEGEGPIEIEHRNAPLRIVLVNTSQTVGTNRIQLEHKTNGDVEELESQRYSDTDNFENVIDWLEHFCNKSRDYL